MENREDNVCKLCLKTKVKYTCPRCNIQYCSLECYKSEKHLQCSENFYKECFMEGLKDFGSSKEDKQNVLEMLQRVKDEDPGFDSDDDEDLEARLQGLDLETDSKTVWNKLTDKEKKEFERLMAGGELSTLVEVWTPWWKDKLSTLIEVWMPWWNDKVLISEIKEKKEKTRIPAIQKDITDISTLLSKGKPSADLKNNVINVLYAYCFVCRLYNGDHISFPIEVTKEVLSVSKVLSGTAVSGSPPEAIQMCFQCLQHRDKENLTSRQFNISLIEDVIRIIQGPSQYDPLQFVMAALSELILLFHKTMSELTTGMLYRDQVKMILYNHVRIDNRYVIQGPSQYDPLQFVMAALSELVLLFHKTMSELTTDIKKSKEEKTRLENKDLKKKVFISLKKVEFLLSWTQRFGMALQSAVTELQLEFCAMSSDLAEVNETKQKVEHFQREKQLKDNRKLVQEI
ncbi:zinc finger HIT domain-containing protein 2-like [Mytilus galloprovincialis]|uniref:zinc finger HIT domain-containing protein 2-like n=1 Tax=Mytilus galloprovincialis TaxID=29158 RepID=UPI003F7B5F3C